jgi:hypothetical protein
MRLFFLVFAIGVGGELLMARQAAASPTCVVREVEGDEHNGFWCFAVGLDNAIWRISYDENNGGWDASWRSIGGAVQGNLSCIGAAAPDRARPTAPVDPNPDDNLGILVESAPQDWYRCHARGFDGAIQVRSIGLARAGPAGGTLAGSPDCVLSGQCFARGPDNALIRSYRDTRAWSGWTSLGGVAMSDPECVNSPRRADCFVRNSNNGLSHIACLSRQPCAQWSTLDGTFSGRPSCVSAVVGSGVATRLARIDCFVLGTDNTVFQKTYTGAWSDWQRVGTRRVFGDPECVALSDFRTLCFARNEGGYLISATREGDRWTEWTLAGNIPLSGHPSCFFRPVYNVAHCVGRGASGRMVHTQINFGGANTTEEVRDFVVRE